MSEKPLPQSSTDCGLLIHQTPKQYLLVTYTSDE